MDVPAANRSAQNSPASHAAFLAGWLFPQLLVLGLSASRIGMWAKAPAASELLALPMMLCVQIALAALMFREMKGEIALLALAAAWPLGLISGLLSAASASDAVRGELGVSLWILTVALASVTSESWKKPGIAWAASLIWSLGGALLFYLRQEFSSTAFPLSPLACGPMICVVQIATRSSNFWFTPLLSSTAIFGLLWPLTRAFCRRG